MLERNVRDMVGGALLAILGLAAAWYASTHYSIGTIRTMGPGMVPMAVGYITAGLGAVLLVQAFFQKAVAIDFQVWPPLFILLGVAAFALLIRSFGLVPAVLATIILSSFAELKFRPLTLAVLSVTLAVLVYLIFVAGLKFPINLFNWPF